MLHQKLRDAPPPLKQEKNVVSNELLYSGSRREANGFPSVGMVLGYDDGP